MAERHCAHFSSPRHTATPMHPHVLVVVVIVVVVVVVVVVVGVMEVMEESANHVKRVVGGRPLSLGCSFDTVASATMP